MLIAAGHVQKSYQAICNDRCRCCSSSRKLLRFARILNILREKRRLRCDFVMDFGGVRGTVREGTVGPEEEPIEPAYAKSLTPRRDWAQRKRPTDTNTRAAGSVALPPLQAAPCQWPYYQRRWRAGPVVRARLTEYAPMCGPRDVGLFNRGPIVFEELFSFDRSEPPLIVPLET